MTGLKTANLPSLTFFTCTTFLTEIRSKNGEIINALKVTTTSSSRPISKNVEMPRKEELIKNLNYYNIYESVPDSRRDRNKLRCQNYGDSFQDLMNSDQMRNLLHIPAKIPKWVDCIEDEDWTYKILPEGSTWIFPLLISNGYEVLLYSGTADLACPTLGNHRWIQNLNLPV